MKKIVSVRFKEAGKSYYFNPPAFNLKAGDKVIVETSRGTELGTVALGIQEISDDKLHSELKDVLRVATKDDIERYNENKKLEKEAFGICRKKIAERGLEMKLIEVEYTFDRNKILFYFTAEGRVDFRELVKELATVFRTRIELRQIGVRDESKTLGSIGVCGRGLCCSKWLDEFVPVSIKMAKEQGLSLNPTKISSACGRLMCCLKYEQDMYEELISEMPKPDQTVNTPEGMGKVAEINLLKGVVKVTIEDGSEITMHEFKANEVSPVKNSGKFKQKQDVAEEIEKNF